MMLFYALISAVIVSLISLMGIFFIFFKKKVDNIIFILVAFAAGALIGNAFFHIIPESFEKLNSEIASLIIVSGFLFFFFIEKGIHWQHCHDKDCKEHDKKHLSYLNLIGDGIHNFLDGILIAVSYAVSFPIGIATTIAVIAHEIPQEIGDFGILLYSGLSKWKALIFNLISASLAILGVILVYFGLIKESLTLYFLPAVAGGFLYIAMSDLVPELHKETRTMKTILSFLFLFLGLILMYLLKILMR